MGLYMLALTGSTHEYLMTALELACCSRSPTARSCRSRLDPGS